MTETQGTPSVYGLNDEPVGLSSTTGSKLQMETVGGLDWFEITVYGAFNAILHSEAIKDLLEGQEAARNGDSEAAMIKLGGMRHAKVYPGVKRHGNTFLHYVFDSEGIQYRINGVCEHKDGTAAASVQIGSETLMRMGGRAAWLQAVRLLRQVFGLEISDTCVSRVDLCVDLPGEDARELIAKIRQGERFICRAREAAGHWKVGHAMHSMRIGTKTKLRIYDKAQELRDKPNPTKHALIKAVRWAGEDPSTALRVEYQLSREVMANNFDVRTVGELWDSLPAIARNLTFEWSRVVLPFDKRNPTRAKVDPVWIKVQQRFIEWTGDEKQSVTPRDRPAPSMNRLTAQAVGCLESVIAMTGRNPSTADEVMACIEDMLRGQLSDSSDRIEKKRVDYGSRGSIEPPQPWEDLMRTHLDRLPPKLEEQEGLQRAA